jgi:hypothetical protein
MKHNVEVQGCGASLWNEMLGDDPRWCKEICANWSERRERMMRMDIAQQCFGRSDEGTEDAFYDSQAIRGFVGIDLDRESVPDVTTLLKFRRLLEEHQLTERVFATINAHPTEYGLLLKEGSIS